MPVSKTFLFYLSFPFSYRRFQGFDYNNGRGRCTIISKSMAAFVSRILYWVYKAFWVPIIYPSVFLDLEKAFDRVPHEG